MTNALAAHVIALVTLLGAGALLAFVPDAQIPHALLTGYIGTILGAYFGPAGSLPTPTAGPPAPRPGGGS